jgi:hypothetical protein
MASQDERDEKTLQIFAALAIFIGVVAVGGIVLLLLGRLVDVGDGTATLLFWLLMAVGAGVAARYLVRRSRR